MFNLNKHKYMSDLISCSFRNMFNLNKCKYMRYKIVVILWSCQQLCVVTRMDCGHTICGVGGGSSAGFSEKLRRANLSREHSFSVSVNIACKEVTGGWQLYFLVALV